MSGSGPTCPKCGCGEVNPETGKLWIRAYKFVDEDGRDWSHCLVCSGCYMPDRKTPNPNYNPQGKGYWFC